MAKEAVLGQNGPHIAVVIKGRSLCSRCDQAETQSNTDKNIAPGRLCSHQ
jgi:hypothetical protein